MKLSIITLGHVHSEDLAPLTTRFDHLEQLVLDIDPRHPVSMHRAEFQRALDASSASWILIIRERERIDEALAAEIAANVQRGGKRALKIRTEVIYAGSPLRIPGDDEVRLFEKDSHDAVDGSLQAPFRAFTFESAEAHRQYLQKNFPPHSMLRRVLLFLRNAVALRTADRNTLRYLWIEAAFDKA